MTSGRGNVRLCGRSFGVDAFASAEQRGRRCGEPGVKNGEWTTDFQVKGRGETVAAHVRYSRNGRHETMGLHGQEARKERRPGRITHLPLGSARQL